MPKAASERKAANGYKLAKPLPAGEILEDVAKKKWKLGLSIGKGGFGEIYSAQEYGTTGSKYPYVVKIEPHENGPLFVEMHMYIKIAKQDDVEAFKSQKGLKTFGMPIYFGSGSHEFNGEKYRFIVMEKFGTDLWKIFLEHNRHFPSTTVFKIAVQILDILEYIHGKGYVHADIKGANILMGATKGTLNKQVYLVDFGLAAKCNDDLDFKPNHKKANDGTIEYLSRDAHKGVQTKRGDLETLAYNLIQWLGCTLPWEKNLKDPAVVQKSKEEYMSSVFKLIKACFDKRSPPGPLVDFLNCLSTLSHNSTPDYKNIRKIFMSGIDPGDALGKPLQFTVPEKSSPKKSPVKRKKADVPKTLPKRKQLKMQVKEEESEGEKENFEEDEPVESDKEDLEIAANENRANDIKEPKGKKNTGNRRKTAKTKNVKDIAEFGENDTESIHKDEEIDEPKKQVKEEESEDEQIKSDQEEVKITARMNKVKVTKDPKGKGRIKPAKRKNVKDVSDIEENDDEIIHKDDEVDELDDLTCDTKETDFNRNSSESTDSETYKSKKKAKKLKPVKGLKRVSAEEEDQTNEIDKDEPVPEPPTRTRLRGRQINYKEDSDDEGKQSRKRGKNPVPTKELHVTGDNLDGYTDAKKPVSKKKLQSDKTKKTTAKKTKVNEDETTVPSTIAVRAKKNRVVKNVEDI